MVRNSRYLLVNIKAVVLGFMAITLIATAFVLFLKSLSIFLRFEIMLGFIAVSLFLFLTLGLFRGVRLKNDVYEKNSDKDKKAIIFESMFDFIDLPLLAASGSITWLVASVVIVLLLGIALGGFSLLIGALGWIFYRALRLVFIKSRESKGNLAISAKYALMYTTLYTSWLFAIIWLVKLFKNNH